MKFSHTCLKESRLQVLASPLGCVKTPQRVKNLNGSALQDNIEFSLPIFCSFIIAQQLNHLLHNRDRSHTLCEVSHYTRILLCLTSNVCKKFGWSELKKVHIVIELFHVAKIDDTDRL